MISLLLLGFLLLVLSSPPSQAKVVPLIQPGFFFDYDIPEQPVRIPITVQCERIHIKWGRDNAIGQNPTAPYLLQVYTSIATTPFIIPAGDGLSFDWDVPFAPGTQYQICMFDHNGVPGGCQAMYTMVQNATVANPVCQNVTAPPQLAIEGRVAGGPISQYGFIDQEGSNICTDISITPKGGKPPYTLTVAPPLHPPYNITSNNMDPIVWTVSLSWSYPFFMSLVSSDGQMWANGPMHAGGFGPDSCLSPGSISHNKAAGIAAGASLAALFGGLLLGFAGFKLFWVAKRKRSGLEPRPFMELKDSDAHSIVFDNTSGRPLPEIPERFTSLTASNEWDPHSRPAHYTPARRPSRTPSNDSSAGSTYDTDLDLPVRTRTVIVHYDGGRARAGRQQPEEVVELPPEYRRPSMYSDSASEPTPGPSRPTNNKVPRH